VVEWAEHARGFIPDEHLRISLRFVSQSKRAVQMVPHGADYEALVRRFQALAFRT
jgi:tRNA A37 threonylcarbamoyladenosine biosynthesis protein TsaE